MMDHAEMVRQEEALLCRTYARYPVAVARGHGSHILDADGREYVDLLAGIAVTGLGHCNEEVVEALVAQARRLWHVSNLFYQEPQLELARRLLAESRHDRAFFCNSGAEANEAAFKLARRYMSRVVRRDAHEIISLTSCFHGRTFGALAATGRDTLTDGFHPLPAGFRQVPAGDIAALEAAATPATAAIVLEVIQGEAGVLPLPSDYLKDVQQLCRDRDILLICDEVQCGLCRSGRFWAWQAENLEPDIVTSAKALANGLPMGAMLATERVAHGFVPGSHATTFGGGALVAAAAAKVVEIMRRDNLDQRAARLGNAFHAKVEDLMRRLPGRINAVRGRGLMIGIEIAHDGRRVWEELLGRGFICNFCHGDTLRLLPALTIASADLDAFLVALEDILKAR